MFYFYIFFFFLFLSHKNSKVKSFIYYQLIKKIKPKPNTSNKKIILALFRRFFFLCPVLNCAACGVRICSLSVLLLFGLCNACIYICLGKRFCIKLYSWLECTWGGLCLQKKILLLKCVNYYKISCDFPIDVFDKIARFISNTRNGTTKKNGSLFNSGYVENKIDPFRSKIRERK